MLFRPRWVDRFERRLASSIPLRQNGVSLVKVGVALLFVAGLLNEQPAWWVLSVFACFLVLDYLDGAVAKGRGQQTTVGLVLDRICDLPVLVGIWWVAGDALPALAVGIKLGLDAILLVQFLRGVQSTENRVRTALHYGALGALLASAKGWMPALVSASLVAALYWSCAGFSALVVLNNARVFQKRFVADAMSSMNLCAGLASIALASRGRYELSVVCLLLGAAFDGFDGAAARRWGGTAIGVYADDVADAVNYGLAPGSAVYFALCGGEGLLLGGLYAAFTITRLVYFTLAKGEADPEYFRGAPSTVGGLVVLSGLALFSASPATVGWLVGAASVLMVSFGTSYRHLGRLVARRPRLLLVVPGVILLLLAGYPSFGPAWPIAWLLAACLVYGLLPVLSAFRALLQKASRGGPARRGT